MAVYNCECGLIISTSSDRPRCLRCLRVLGPHDLVERVKEPTGVVTSTVVALIEQRRQYRQVTPGYRLSERPVLTPVVRPK
jgi:hypothetical protein